MLGLPGTLGGAAILLALGQTKLFLWLAIFAILFGSLHAMLDDPRCGRILSVEVSALDPVMGRHRNRTLKRLAALAVTFLPADARRSLGSTRVWSIAFSGGVNEVVVNSLSAPEDWKVDVVAAELARIWARTLET